LKKANARIPRKVTHKGNYAESKFPGGETGKDSAGRHQG